MVSNQSRCPPRWSQGNVLASRSKVRVFKPDWGWWIFSGRKNPEHKSSGRELWVPSPISGSLKKLKPENIGLLAKFNRHIHILVISQFGEHNRSQKGRSALGINTIQYNLFTCSLTITYHRYLFFHAPFGTLVGVSHTLQSYPSQNWTIMDYKRVSLPDSSGYSNFYRQEYY